MGGTSKASKATRFGMQFWTQASVESLKCIFIITVFSRKLSWISFWIKKIRRFFNLLNEWFEIITKLNCKLIFDLKWPRDNILWRNSFCGQAYRPTKGLKEKKIGFRHFCTNYMLRKIWLYMSKIRGKNYVIKSKKMIKTFKIPSFCSFYLQQGCCL